MKLNIHFTLTAVFICFINLHIYAQFSDSCLVGYYKMNGNADDSSPLSNHCQVNGATLTTDRFGNKDSAYYFNGNASLYADFSSEKFRQLTVTAWIKTSYTGNYATIVQPASSVLYVNRFEAGKFFATFDGTSWNNNVGNESKTNVANDKWIFVSAVCDGMSTTIYVNGQAEKTFDDFFQPTNGKLTIGRQVNDMWGFIGSIDDVKIYSCALTPAEIKKIYNDEKVTGENEKLVRCTQEDVFLTMPNPSNGNIIIKHDLKKVTDIILNDVSGRLIFTAKVNSDEKEIPLDLSLCEPGIYILQVISAGKICLQKIVVQ